MKRHHAIQGPAVFVMVALLLGAAASVERVREQRYPITAASEPTLYLTSGRTLQRLTAGYNTLAADLYWIRALQYFGGVRLQFINEPSSAHVPSGYGLLYPLLDITTTLDPKFSIAYRFGSIFLADAVPGGAGRPDQAIALLEKGLRAQPDKWQYMQDIGFVHYWWRHDYKAAAGWFERASAAPGGPWFLKSLAATTLAEGGDRQSSRTIWQAILASADNDWLINDAKRRLMQLEAMDMIDELQRRADRVAVASGQPVSDWSEIGNGIPADPTNTPFVIEAGHVRLSPSSPLAPLPTEPVRTVPPVQ